SLDATPRVLPEGIRRPGGVHGEHRGGDRHPRLRPRARPPVPRPQALGRAALLRTGGAAGADPRACSPRGPLRGVGARGARLGGLGATSVLDRLLPARERRQRCDRAPGDAVGPDLRRDDPAPRAERDPSCGRQRVHGRGGRSGRLGGAARVRAVIFDLWDTLVEWPVGEAVRMRERMAAIVGVGEDEFLRRWAATYRASQTGPLADAYLALGIPSEEVDAEVAE